jgi:hypothetical protein
VKGRSQVVNSVEADTPERSSATGLVSLIVNILSGVSIVSDDTDIRSGLGLAYQINKMTAGSSRLKPAVLSSDNKHRARRLINHGVRIGTKRLAPEALSMRTYDNYVRAPFFCFLEDCLSRRSLQDLCI